MKKFLSGFRFAFKGLSYAYQTQINFKVHFFAGLLAVLLGWYLQINQNQWLWLSLAIALVLLTELLNTAIEVLVDLISPGYHVKAGIIKDISAAAVLISAIFAIVVGLIIFIPHIINNAS